MTDQTTLLDIRGLQKDYRSLRPLRIQQLTLRKSDVVAISGLDLHAAEMLVTLITGASLPDEGAVTLFGQRTAEIEDSEAWLQSLDGVGMISERVVLLEPFTVRQNIALSLTLDVDPIAADVLEQVDRLADEAGLAPADRDQPVAGLGPERQMRVRLARALALGPRLLLAEHPSARLSRDGVEPFASDLARIARARELGLLAITADAAFARALGGEHFTLEPATGAWKPQGLWARVKSSWR